MKYAITALTKASH